MLIDTHCHLAAAVFDQDREQVVKRAQEAGVSRIVIPAVDAGHFAALQAVAHATPGAVYALGIHPYAVPRATDGDLDVLEAALARALAADNALVAVGEIGLDFFRPELKTDDMRKRQEHFYIQQLALAERFGLPVILHAVRSQDMVLKHVRQHSTVGGIAHAFNGSFQQANQFMDHGFALGMGGVMTFKRARQIRRLATRLPLDALVLETDAPDMPPAWLGGFGTSDVRNEPREVAGVAQCLADLRGMNRKAVIAATAETAFRVLPRLRRD